MAERGSLPIVIFEGKRETPSQSRGGPNEIINLSTQEASGKSFLAPNERRLHLRSCSSLTAQTKQHPLQQPTMSIKTHHHCLSRFLSGSQKASARAAAGDPEDVQVETSAAIRIPRVVAITVGPSNSVQIARLAGTWPQSGPFIKQPQPPTAASLLSTTLKSIPRWKAVEGQMVT